MSTIPSNRSVSRKILHQDGAYAMDGRTRSHSLILLFLAVATTVAGNTAVAQDGDKSTPIQQQLYESPVLKEAFLGAQIVELRLNESEDASRPPSGEIELRSKNTKKPPKYRSKFVSITLERIPAAISSKGDTAPDDATVVYSVSGVPVRPH